MLYHAIIKNHEVVFEIFILTDFSDTNKFATLSLTPVIHPQGQCCKVIFNNEEKLSGHGNVMIGFKLDEQNVAYNEFRVFLSHPKTSTYFKLNNFYMDSRLVFTRSQIKIIKVRVTEEHFLEDSADSNCKNYHHSSNYHEVKDYKD